MNPFKLIAPALTLMLAATVSLKAQEASTDDAVGNRQEGRIVPSALSLRANLLRWATLTPDLGLEWRINDNWGLLVNGCYTSWTWNFKNGRYAIREVSPEVRRYFGKMRRGYLGAAFKAGQFNTKFGETGKQGDIIGGGLTGGFQLPLNKCLALDFSLGLGYIRADYEKYTVINDVRVRRGKESGNWWGPTSAGVTLVWTIF